MDWGNNNQYSTTSYGGQGGANGGGFMSNEQQSSPGGGKKFDRDESLRPVTIKQLLDAEGDHSSGGAEFKVDGELITQIVIVGQIRNVSTNSMRISYKVDDGTGVIDVNRFLGDEKSAFEDGTLATLPQDTYIKAFGRLKEFGSTRHVLALIMRPIEDHNEISCHLLESTLVHLQTSRGLPSKDGTNTRTGAGDDMDVDGGLGNGMDNAKNLSGLSVNAKKVYQYIEEAKQSHEGVHLQQIAQGLHMELNQIQKGGNELLDKGLIYSTVDEDTWALLEM